MKKTFVVEIEIAEPWIVDEFDFSESRIEESFQRGIGELLPYAYESETKVKAVEQTCGTLDNTGEKEEKPIQISNDSPMESGDDYLEERFNDLLER